MKKQDGDQKSGERAGDANQSVNETRRHFAGAPWWIVRSARDISNPGFAGTLVIERQSARATSALSSSSITQGGNSGKLFSLE